MDQTTEKASVKRLQVQFILRKLHSLTGLLPIGVFLLEHFYQNFSATGPHGREAFDEVVFGLQTNPMVVYAEIGAIGLPLLYHGIYGLALAREARPNALRYGTMRNWFFTLQRVTGALLVLYIGMHVYKTRLAPIFNADHVAEYCTGKMEGLICYDYMRNYLGEERILGLPVVAIYVAGILSAVFHFCNGLWSMGYKWGLTVGPRAQRASGYVCALIGIALAFVGLQSLIAFVRPA